MHATSFMHYSLSLQPPIDESFESELRPSEPERPRASQEDIDALAAALNDLPGR